MVIERRSMIVEEYRTVRATVFDPAGKAVTVKVKGVRWDPEEDNPPPPPGYWWERKRHIDHYLEQPDAFTWGMVEEMQRWAKDPLSFDHEADGIVLYGLVLVVEPEVNEFGVVSP
jgi:hypothetical protein